MSDEQQKDAEGEVEGHVRHPKPDVEAHVRHPQPEVEAHVRHPVNTEPEAEGDDDDVEGHVRSSRNTRHI
jgi:hypothetical protein